MTTIVTRAGKGTPLTNNEVDTNFTNLNTDKLELGSTFSSGTANSVLYLNASKVATSGSALTFDGTSLGVGAAWTTNPMRSTQPQYFQYGAASTANVIAADGVALFQAMRFSSNNSGAFLILSKGRGTYASPTAVASGDNIGSLDFRVYGGTNSRTVAQINGVVDAYTSDANISSYLTFGTSPSGSAAVTERVRITSGGQLNLGGNFTSTNNTLQVTGNAAIGYTAAAPANGLIVAGNVGIGTDNPGYKLHVNGNVYASAIQIGEVSAFLSNSPDALIGWAASFSGYTNGTLILQSRSSAGTPIVFATGTTSASERAQINSSGTLILRQSSNAANTSVSFNTTVQNALTLGSDGNLAVGESSTANARLFSYISSNSVPSMVVRQDGTAAIQTWQGSGGGEKARITSDGNLGIGETNPAAKLDVLTTGQALKLATAANQTHIELRDTTNSKSGYINYNNDSLIYYRNGPVMSFTVDTSNTFALRQSSNAANTSVSFNTTVQNALTLDSSGRLGVGTGSPAARFNVEGGEFLLRGGQLTIGPTAGGNGAGAIRSALNGVLGSLIFQTEDSNAALVDRMTLDSSGNLGLGVTPSTWASNFVAMQIGPGATVNSASDGRAAITSNIFIASGPTAKYIANGFGSAYTQLNGAHLWFTAPNNTSGPNIDASGGSTTMTLDASGRLGIGATSVTNGTAFGGGSQVNVLKVESAGYPCVQVNTNTGGGGSLQFTNSGTVNGIIGYNASGAINEFSINNVLSGPLVLATSNGEKARITSGGYFKASNDGNYVLIAGSFHEMVSNDTGNTLVVRNSNTSTDTDGTIFISNARNTTNNTYYLLSAYNTTATAFKFRVADSGDVTNTNGTYGTISDAKMKTDIVDAGSQWSDIKALRFRKFKMKDDPSGLVQLGVVAQEVELTSPGLVDEHADRDAEGNDLGTTTKSVKTSVLLMKAAVALQEAMARIEQLEAKVVALEAK